MSSDAAVSLRRADTETRAHESARRAPLASEPREPWELLVGSYTEAAGGRQLFQGTGLGITRFSYAAGGRLTPSRQVVRARNPSSMALNATGDVLYAACETRRFRHQDSGSVIAFSRDPATGHLRLLSERSSGGSQPCHIAVDPADRYALVANFGSNSLAAFALAGDGGLGQRVDTRLPGGRHAIRHQATSGRPHQACFDPHTGHAVIPMLGSNQVTILSVAQVSGRRVRHVATVRCPPGAGPRRVLFDRSGEHLFILNQRSNSVSIAARRGEGFEVVHTASTLPPSYPGPNQAAGLRMSTDARFLLVSNRGHNSIGVFLLPADPTDAWTPTWTSTTGRDPRDFCFSPDGAFVFVAHQSSHDVVRFRFHSTGKLSLLDRVRVRSPACLLFAPLRPSPANEGDAIAA